MGERKYERSPLTNTQEKLLLERLSDLRWGDGPMPKEPAEVAKARAVVAKFADARDKRRELNTTARGDAYIKARDRVVFAKTREEALAAVDEFEKWLKHNGFKVDARRVRFGGVR